MSTNLIPTALDHPIGLENSEPTHENPPQEEAPMDPNEQVTQLSLGPASSGSGEAPIDPGVCELVHKSRKHDDECPICYTEYESRPEIILHNQCRHTFCPGCFLYATWQTFKCPMCRQTIRLSPELTQIHANLVRRMAQLRNLQQYMDLIHQLLDLIDTQLTTLEQEETAAASDPLKPPSLFPIFSLQTLVTHSRRRLASRAAYVERPYHHSIELHRISVKLSRATTQFYRVFHKLSVRHDPRKTAEYRMAEGCFQL